jgi:hypothetical protein
MKHAIHDFTKLAASMFVIVAISLALGGVAYQFFSPDGALFLWVSSIGHEDPLLLLLVGGVLVIAKRWMEGYERSATVADAMVYLAVLFGIYFGITLVLAAG